MVYDHYIYVYSYNVGIDFRRQPLTSTDVRVWRLKSILALQGLTLSCWSRLCCRFKPFLLVDQIIDIQNEIGAETSRFVNVWSHNKQINFQPLEVVDRGSETQPQVVEN